jgi:fatty acid desaturase
MTAQLTALAPARRAEGKTSDYGTLLAQVRRARLLDRSALSYLPRALVLLVLVAAGVTAFVWLGESWWQLAVAAYFGIIFTQLGFLGHDAGHQQICRSRRVNDAVGLTLSNLAIGMSYGWWLDKHNRHHSHPNHVGKDPDVNRNVLAWTQAQAESQRGILRFIARHQAVVFFPLLLMEAWNLHLGSIRALVAKPRGRRMEIGLLCAHAAGYLTLMLLFLSPLQAVAFVAVQQSLFGLYLGCSFAPNHKGMQIVDEGDASVDFLRRQVLTSRNVGSRGVVRSGLLRAAFGGLTYQIEHHLFPSMPSRNLRQCRPIVKAFCAAHGVDYCETSLLGSYGRVLRYLDGIRPAKSRLPVLAPVLGPVLAPVVPLPTAPIA